MGVTTVAREASAEARDERIKREIQEMLDKVKALCPDAVVLFVAYGDKVSYRYVGTPAELFNLAQMGHAHVMESFKLEAAQPLPGQKVN